MASSLRRHIAALTANMSQLEQRIALVKLNKGSTALIKRLEASHSKLSAKRANARALLKLGQTAAPVRAVHKEREPYEVYGLTRPAPAHDLSEFDDPAEDIAGFLRENSMSIY